MEIRVLGPLGVVDAGRPVALGGRRQRSVLAGLVIHAGEAVSTDALIDLVWGDDPPATARKSLQTYVSRLRRILGDQRIEATLGGYLLRVAPEQLDARRFEVLADTGRQLAVSDPVAAWDRLTEALTLWRGAPLSDIGVDDSEVAAYAWRLGEARLAAIEDRFEVGLVLGRATHLIADLRAHVDAHPLRERAWGQLMLALYRSDRQAEALDAFQRCRQLLADELGIEPSEQLRRLHEQMLRHDPALAAAPTTGPVRSEDLGPVRNPYKGLRAFSETDTADYFGREALVADLLGRLDAGTRFLALVGPSGSGKSSVALAGLIPAVRESASGRARLAARMTPGTHPFAQLEAALTRAAQDAAAPVQVTGDDDLDLLRAVLTLVPDEHTDLLLVIDQFEELLTSTAPTDTAGRFLRNLREAVEDPHGQLVVVVTLRGDFYDTALRQPELAGLLVDGVVSVPPLTSAELQAAVVRPAQAVGLMVEPELVADLVAESARQPASLPLLQFVLTELTDHADGRTLTHTALQEAGGIQGTFARRAEARYSSLTDEGREAARRLMLRLVTLDEVGEATRRIALLDQLSLPDVADMATQEALETLVVGRLLAYDRDPVSGRATVEVAHEAVLREWPRCVRWIEEARADIRMTLELERAAQDWTAAGSSPDYLLTGSRLRLFEEWAEHTDLGTTSTAARFLAASLQRREEEERREAARVERERLLERRAVMRLRAGVGVLALLVAVTTALTLFAFRQAQEAERQRTAVIAATSESLVRQLSFAAVAEAGRDPELSLLLALHAVAVATVRDQALPTETVEALHWGLQELRVQYPVRDGQVLLLIGTEGPRGAYDLPVAELVQLAMGNVTRQLTAEECRTFLPGGECPEPLPHEPWADLPATTKTTEGSETLEGTTVRVVGLRTELDADLLRRELESFTAATGVQTIYTEDTNLDIRMAAGELGRGADVALIPQPGQIATEAAAGLLMDLGRYLDREQVVADYGLYLASLATIGHDGAFPSADGTLYALPLDVVVKSLIWYSPRRFAEAGYEVPATWDDLISLSDRIVADGDTPWCFAEESGDASGWPATDWIEHLLLAERGPEVYDAWVAREIPFQDVRVRTAFERLGQLMFTEGYVRGGPSAALTTPFWAGIQPLLDDPPGCWLHRQASSMALAFPPGTEVGHDISAFPISGFGSGLREAMIVGGESALVYTDRPEVRALVRYLASPDYGQAFVTHPGFLAANSQFDVARYPDEWRRVAAAEMLQARDRDRLRFDGSDLMPPWLGTKPFWAAMVDYIAGGPETLDGILERLDAIEDPGGGG
ncbi:extracellular solute-binding protein [Nitriliruptor alkaliphilus]|uniref:extracellular solute-binding protein n=1 Tax=Nitriliruptor alkaliphilus TaxID=427918 RepID=UPI000698A122|nr:extracellular solute-binding protein [Nitriliruptor alkaliphilus]